MRSSPKSGAKLSHRILMAVPGLLLLVVLVGAPVSADTFRGWWVAQATPTTRLGAGAETGRRGGLLRGKDMAPSGSSASTPDATGEGEPASSSEGEPAQPLGTRIRRFIKENVTWILTGLLIVLGIAVIWTVFGTRGGKGRRGALDDLSFGGSGAEVDVRSSGSRRFSSTRIQSAEIGQRLSGVKSTQVETDREYALIVDEEALKRPPLPDGESGEHSASAVDVERIRQLLNSDRYLDAYQEYARLLAEDRKRIVPSDVERSLGEFLMKVKEFDRAAKVLGHHVASQPATHISADTYFNLGYIHFMRRSLDKARRFFKLFIKVEKNPEYIARARKILEKIDSSGSVT